MIHPDIHNPSAPEPIRRRGRRFYSAVRHLLREAGLPLSGMPRNAADWHEDTDDLPVEQHALFLGVAGLLLLSGEDDPARGRGTDHDQPGDVWVSLSTSNVIQPATARAYIEEGGDRDAALIVPEFRAKVREAVDALEVDLAVALLEALRPGNKLNALNFAHVLTRLGGRDPSDPDLLDAVTDILNQPIPTFSPAYASQELPMCVHPDLYDGAYDAKLTRLYAAVRHLLKNQLDFPYELPNRPSDWASFAEPSDPTQLEAYKAARSRLVGVYGLLRLDGVEDPAAGGQLRRTSAGDIHLLVTDTETLRFVDGKVRVGSETRHLSDLTEGQNATIVRIVPGFVQAFLRAVNEYTPNKLMFQNILPLVQKMSTSGGSTSFNTADLAGIARRLIENGAPAGSSQLELLVEEAFTELLGGRVDGRAASIPIDLPDLEEDANDTIVGDNITGLQALYYCAMLEEMKFFAVAEKVAELFVLGAVPISRGPAGQDLYDYLRDAPNRFTEVDRRSLYGRTFGLAMGSVDVAAPNREFSDLWLRFLSTASYLRREVGSQEVRQVTQQTVAKAAQDLAVNLSLHGYGVGYFAAVELQRLVKTVLEMLNRPDVLSAFGAATRWQLVERVSDMYLGGAVNGVKHRTMASSGAAIIQWLGVNAKQLGPNTWDPNANQALHEHIDRWLAVMGAALKDVERHSEPINTPKQPTIPSWSFSGASSLDDAMKKLDAVIPEAK